MMNEYDFVVDGCSACDPIKELVIYLQNKGFHIVEKELSDYHFHQLYFKLANKDIKKIMLQIDDIQKIKQYSSTKFICDCHWSTVDIE
jgi:hypothetical protein